MKNDDECDEHNSKSDYFIYICLYYVHFSWAKADYEEDGTATKKNWYYEKLIE